MKIYIYKVQFCFDNGASYDTYIENIASPTLLDEVTIKRLLRTRYDDYEGVIENIRILTIWVETEENFTEPILL